MKTIEENYQNEIVINKSKFITFLIKINSINEAENNILNIKKKFKDATHYCYSYIIDNVKRFEDDGEPSGTAGIPILNVLENNELNNILCVVVRYFGGIKLGAGGLVRAYTKATSSCLKEASIKYLKKYYKIKITFNYDNVKNIDNLLKDYNIIEKQFTETITYIFYIEIDNPTLELLKNLNSFQIIEELYL